jgi:hypothetical protein
MMHIQSVCTLLLRERLPKLLTRSNQGKKLLVTVVKETLQSQVITKGNMVSKLNESGAL